MCIKYFLPLNTANVSQYFSRCILLPSSHVEGWIVDSQSKFSNYILLSNKPVVNKKECCLEIVLTKDEEKEIISLDGDLSLFNKPLPLSRVKHLCFSKKNSSKNTVYNIEKGDAFIPSHLIEVLDDSMITSTIEIPSQQISVNANDWIKKKNLFNKILGGLALMQISKEKWQNYPTNYFNVFAFLNQKIKVELKSQYSKYIYNPFLIDNNGDAKSNFFRHIDKRLVLNRADKENIKLKEEWGQLNYGEIDENSTTYLLSILASFGNDIGKVKSIDDFISSIINKKFSKERSEELCLVFGLNQGYFAFRNKYKFSECEMNVKFKLDSEIDYSIIESVYQYVFNNNDKGEFSYLDQILPTYNKRLDKSKYKTYKILDKDIIYELKPTGIKELIKSFIKRFFFSDLAGEFIADIEKKEGFSLNEVQKEVTRKKIESFVQTPFQEYRDKLENEICSYHEDVVSELKSKIFELEKKNRDLESEKKDLSLMLADRDKDLFDKIDKDGDGELSHTEVGTFIDSLIRIKSVLTEGDEQVGPKISDNNEDTSKTSLHQPNTDLNNSALSLLGKQSPDKETVNKEQTDSDSFDQPKDNSKISEPLLFDEKSSKKENNSDGFHHKNIKNEVPDNYAKNRKSELSRLGITALRSVARDLRIRNKDYKYLKNTKSDISKLIVLIMAKELK